MKKGEKKKEGKKKEQKEWIRKLKKLLIEIGLLEEEETEKQVYESYYGSRECLQDTRKLSKSAVVYPEEVLKTVAQPEYRPTVCLNSMTGKVRGMLLYQGAESYEDICVTKKMTRIGYGSDADIQIQADTISQLHARIDHDGETFYVILEILGNTENSEFMVRMGAVWPPYVKQGEYWRLFTATFMHFGFEHILNNMLVLICAGPILEKAMGHIKYLCLYLIAGVGGSTLSYVQMIARGKYDVSAGASGAIFGIIGALLWIVMIHKGRYESLTGKGLLFMIVISLYYGITSVAVDNWAHIGGLAMGFVFAIILYRKPRKAVDLSGENPYTN